MLQMILFSGIAGITVFLGGLLANVFDHHTKESLVKERITHSIAAFGGGVILSALALVLVPKGMEALSLGPLLFSFGLGAVLFFYIDRYLANKGGKLGTLLAMMMDFVPESIALGAVFVLDPKAGALLAVFMGLQNLPEAFNAFRDLVLSGFKVKTVLIIFFFLSFVGILGALTGHYLLQDAKELTAHLMIFASGGILYLVFQDIAPESKIEKQWSPALGACLGFMVGMIGEKLV